MTRAIPKNTARPINTWRRVGFLIATQENTRVMGKYELQDDQEQDWKAGGGGDNFKLRTH